MQQQQQHHHHQQQQQQQQHAHHQRTPSHPLLLSQPLALNLALGGPFGRARGDDAGAGAGSYYHQRSASAGGAFQHEADGPLLFGDPLAAQAPLAAYSLQHPAAGAAGVYAPAPLAPAASAPMGGPRLVGTYMVTTLGPPGMMALGDIGGGGAAPGAGHPQVAMPPPLAPFPGTG
jgi:hypothetical protein